MDKPTARGLGNKRGGNFFDRIFRQLRFGEEISRIDRIENFYRRARKERREKVVQSINPILKILLILSKKMKL